MTSNCVGVFTFCVFQKYKQPESWFTINSNYVDILQKITANWIDPLTADSYTAVSRVGGYRFIKLSSNRPGDQLDL